MKIYPVGAEFFFHENMLTEMTKLIVAIRNFANRTKNVYLTKANGFSFSEIIYLFINKRYVSLDR
jgi:pantothenate kinase